MQGSACHACIQRNVVHDLDRYEDMDFISGLSLRFVCRVG